MSEENYDWLKEIIEDSGHPLSLKISTTPQRKEWFVGNGIRYPSPENGILREIDVFGSKRSKLFPDANNNLIIECKKQKDPWIFFKQGRKIDSIFVLNADHCGHEYGYVSTKQNDRFKKHYYYDNDFCTYHLVGGKKIEKGGPGATIDRAINQVYSALNFFIGSTEGSYPEFFYPVIVFDGEMYEASYRDEELEVKRTDHVFLQFDVAFTRPQIIEQIGSYKIDTVLSSKTHVIDIVKFGYFEKFLDKIDNNI